MLVKKEESEAKIEKPKEIKKEEEKGIKKEEKIKIDDLDKKLDELLEETM